MLLPNTEVVGFAVEVAPKGDWEVVGLAKEDSGLEPACKKGEAWVAKPAIPEALKAEADVVVSFFFSRLVSPLAVACPSPCSPVLGVCVVSDEA